MSGDQAQDAGAKVQGEPPRMKIGVVATDALRILGFQTIFERADHGSSHVAKMPDAEMVTLSVPGVLQETGLSIVLIDASCTDHLVELLNTFRRVRPQVRLIVVGDSNDSDYIERVIGAGARGYLTQSATASEIRTALSIVKDGSVWAPRKVLSRLLDSSGAAHPGAGVLSTHFTTRELEVLRLLVSGLGNREIAEGLRIDKGTVKAHLTRLMRKVGAKNRVELSLRALRHDLYGAHRIGNDVVNRGGDFGG